MALTKISNNSLSAISSLPASIPTGALTLLSTQTASSSASIEFTSGIDSTYDSYIFTFQLHPTGNPSNLAFRSSIDGGSTYGVTTTSTFFRAYHDEADTSTALQYNGGFDIAQGTGRIFLDSATGNGDSNNCCGSLQLFNPSSTTFVKHFISVTQHENDGNFSHNVRVAGYVNTTSAVNAIKFDYDTGLMEDGFIKMYGVS